MENNLTEHTQLPAGTGKLVLISELQTASLIALRTHSRTEIKPLGLGLPEGAVISLEGSRAYVAVGGDAVGAVVDLSNMIAICRVPTGAGQDRMACADETEWYGEL